jgi:hypothetical protein
MSVLHSLELGILGGIALFFVLMYSGLLDKWFR